MVGSQNSSNSRRLVEVCEKAGIPAYLLDDCSEVEAGMLEGCRHGRGYRRRFRARASGGGTDCSFDKRKDITNLEEAEIKEEDVRFTLPSDLESFTPRLYTVRVLADRNRVGTMKSSLQISDSLNLAAADAIRKCSRCAASNRQTGEGFWWADLRADSTSRVRLHFDGAVAASAGEWRLESTHPSED